MLKIYDYNGNPTETNVDLNDENIIAAQIYIVSGDELLLTVTKDGLIRWYDSCDNRCASYYDGDYYIKKGSEIYTTEAWEQQIYSYKRFEIMTDY